MEKMKLEQIRILTDAMTQPVFVAEDGIVCYGNSAFAALQIPVGTALDRFFGTETVSPVSGSAEIPCTVAGIPCSATAMQLDGCILYLLHMAENTISANALSHTVKSIRSSLHEMYSALAGLSDLVESTEDPKQQAASGGILQGIYRLEHTAQNLELLQALSCDSYILVPEQTEVVGFLSALCEHAKELLQYAEIQLNFDLPEKQFSGSIDRALAETVFWNALSNAAANAQNGSVRICAEHRGDLLQLTFLNGGSLLSQSRLFNRYQLAVDEVPANSGTGFGLSVIRKAVALHGGTILFSEKPGEEVAFTLTFDLSLPVSPALHSPMPVQSSLPKGLVFLSDVLPREAYDSRDIL